MNFANVLVLGGSALAAAVAGGLVGSSAPDAGAGISAALLTGLGALMLGGWLTAQRAPARLARRSALFLVQALYPDQR